MTMEISGAALQGAAFDGQKARLSCSLRTSQPLGSHNTMTLPQALQRWYTTPRLILYIVSGRRQ